MSDLLKFADVLDRAADHIDTVGWFQGELFDGYSDPNRLLTECPVCALGALNVVLHGHPYFPTSGLDAHDLATYVERRLQVDELAVWNDEASRTKDDVTAALRETAAELREQVAR